MRPVRSLLQRAKRLGQQLLRWFKRKTADREEVVLSQLLAAQLREDLHDTRTPAAYVSKARAALKEAAACPLCDGTGRVRRRDRTDRAMPTYIMVACSCTQARTPARG